MQAVDYEASQEGADVHDAEDVLDLGVRCLRHSYAFVARRRYLPHPHANVSDLVEEGHLGHSGKAHLLPFRLLQE